MQMLYFGRRSSSDVARVYVLHKEPRRDSPREKEKEVGSGERARGGGGSFQSGERDGESRVKYQFQSTCADPITSSKRTAVQLGSEPSL